MVFSTSGGQYNLEEASRRGRDNVNLSLQAKRLAKSTTNSEATYIYALQSSDYIFGCQVKVSGGIPITTSETYPDTVPESDFTGSGDENEARLPTRSPRNQTMERWTSLVVIIIRTSEDVTCRDAFDRLILLSVRCNPYCSTTNQSMLPDEASLHRSNQRESSQSINLPRIHIAIEVCKN